MLMHFQDSIFQILIAKKINKETNVFVNLLLKAKTATDSKLEKLRQETPIDHELQALETVILE